MRKLLLGIMLGLLLVIPVFAKSEQVTIEGTRYTMDAQERNGRKLYPLRALCDALDIEITSTEYNNVYLKQDDIYVGYLIRSRLICNPSGYFKCDANAISINDTTYVPIRSLAYMFGYDIDTTYGGVSLSKKADFTPPVGTETSRRLGDDLDILADIDDLFDEQRYLNALIEIDTNKDASSASAYRAEMLEIKQEAQVLGRELDTYSAKAIYEEYLNLFEAYAKVFTHAQNFDNTKVVSTLKTIIAIEDRIEQKGNDYTSNIRKNAVLIK